jgi:hypothetical protein
MRRVLWLATVFVACVGVLVAGCGPANPQGRMAISGRVTLEGQPLDQGSIQFTALEGDSGIGSGGVIQNGSYSIETEKGLPPGKYRVRIFSGESAGAPADEMPGESSEAPRERIPAQYNTESTLEIEVAPGKTTFDFNLD